MLSANAPTMIVIKCFLFKTAGAIMYNGIIFDLRHHRQLANPSLRAHEIDWRGYHADRSTNAERATPINKGVNNYVCNKIAIIPPPVIRCDHGGDAFFQLLLSGMGHGVIKHIIVFIIIPRQSICVDPGDC
eukprot:scaffold202921_cov36-Cyclotella_meneghiniana.AAC.2